MKIVRMDAFNQLDTTQRMMYLAGGIVAAAITVIAVKKLVFKQAAHVPNPRDIVILRQIGRGPYAPSMSPFPLKLETYLRMAKIPYQSVHSFKMSTKGKTPWMQYNDDTIADSSFCIEYLNDKFGVDLNQTLSTEQRGIARAFEKMAEEGAVYWSLLLYRWVFPDDRSLVKKVFRLPRFMLWMLSRTFRKAVWAQGTGRHSRDEVDHILEKDLRAISDYLGDKKFMFGDIPTEVDCCLFGILCQPLFNMRGLKPEKILHEKFSNLRDYCERIKSAYWPDWEEKITHGEFCGLGTTTEIREEIIRP